MKLALIYIIALVALFVSAEAKHNKSKKKPKTKGFCVGKRRSDGTQISQGSCSTFIQGDIPSSSRMPSTLIISPDNGATLKANKKFSVDVILENIETGHFSDPDKEYYTKPQQLNDDGLILGHTHVTIQKINGHVPPDAKKFEFFKGVNDKASDGRLSVDVVRENGEQGLPSGHYRICTLTGSLSHQPVLMPIAKRGAQDDCIRIEVEGEEGENTENPKDPKIPKDPKDPKNPKDPKIPKDPKDPKDPKNPKDPKIPKDPKDPKKPKF